MKKTKVKQSEQLRISDSVIFEGDATNVLQRIPSQSVQCVVTSPPYWGLRDYKVPGQIGLEPSLPQFINRLTTIFAETKRVLANDVVLWLNIGDAYTSGNRGWRAPNKKNPVRAMSVRPDTPEGLKPKDLQGIPWRLAFALQDDGWYLRTDIIWNKPNAMPESVKDRPTRSHEYIFMLTKSERYYYDRAAILEDNGRNRRSVWNINTKPYSGAHFATFPLALIEPCILALTRPGDYILDPFF
ncbi:MAG: site-specific DNA-methyltransferase, partial [Alphaproteobacteria bacterium]